MASHSPPAIDPRSVINAPPPRLMHPSQSQSAGVGGITPIARAVLAHRLLDRLRSTRTLFVCVAAHTDTSSIPGISSAGASLDLIPSTPAADLEALLGGRPTSLASVPSNPLGPPGPALITRSALALADMPWLPVSIGLRIQPEIRALDIPHQPGGRIDLQPGVADAAALLEAGYLLGIALARDWEALVIAETVPGGTTTAMAVLRALGHRHRVSSSSADDVLSLKKSVVEGALQRASLRPLTTTLDVLSAVGDPMQPFVLGMLCASAAEIPTVLAGGTQMAAVLALTDRFEREQRTVVPRSNVLLATTPWVARDPQADLLGILRDGGGWAAAIPELDFSAMRCAPLRAYERFLVKEGVGAGGACVTALAQGSSLADLHREIDAEYLSLLGQTND